MWDANAPFVSFSPDSIGLIVPQSSSSLWVGINTPLVTIADKRVMFLCKRSICFSVFIVILSFMVYCSMTLKNWR